LTGIEPIKAWEKNGSEPEIKDILTKTSGQSPTKRGGFGKPKSPLIIYGLQYLEKGQNPGGQVQVRGGRRRKSGCSPEHPNPWKKKKRASNGNVGGV